MGEVKGSLLAMTGPRERCMYCEDSRGTDIEHFWPKKPYRDRVFSWPNLLWICSGCNRCKGKRFPLDDAGNPVLLDPTVDDPWKHFFYEPRTHEITARWDAVRADPDSRAVVTLEVIHTLQHEAVTQGRGRAQRNLQRAVVSFLARSDQGSDDVLSGLWSAIEDADGYGLADWFFLNDGQDEHPFSKLKSDQPETWSWICARLR